MKPWRGRRGDGVEDPASFGDTNTLPRIASAAALDTADATWRNGVIDAEALADMQAFNDLKAKRKKQKRRKIVTTVAVIAGLVVVVGGAGLWYAADQAARALEGAGMQTAVVEQGTFTQTVSASGNLQPVASVSATPEVDGIVGEVFVSEGDTVAAGQTLFTVVNAELDKAIAQAAQAIEEAKNGVAQAQNAVNDAYRSKSAGREAAAQAQAAADAAATAASSAAVAGGAGTSTGGSGSTAIAAQGFDEASADSAIRQAEFALNGANLTLQNAQATHAEAVARGEKRAVKSAIAGSVVSVNVEPGKALGSTSTSGVVSPIQIADLSQMTVSIGVNEIDILKVGADQHATVTFTAALGLELPAKVVRIATTSTSTASGAGSSMSGGAVTYAVKLLIETPDPRLKPGMTAKATIVTQTIERALMVPISAVQSDGVEGSSVMVLVDPETQKVETRKVEVVASDGLITVVKGGVKPGETVVVSGGSLNGTSSADAIGDKEDTGMESTGAAAAGSIVVG
ncbi:MAG: efflux RND transporter periplasmic adaptor subunit [Gordonibacter sp.]|nr:efflux RND transporter periplasmic adaptor subunit [Gordonibacter sp.]